MYTIAMSSCVFVFISRVPSLAALSQMGFLHHMEEVITPRCLRSTPQRLEC